MPTAKLDALALPVAFVWCWVAEASPPSLSPLQPEKRILTIPCRYLMTVEMGKESSIGQKMVKADVDVTAEKHCYLCVFTMVDRRNPDSYFQPYYSASLCPARCTRCHPPHTATPASVQTFCLRRTPTCRSSGPRRS